MLILQVDNNLHDHTSATVFERAHCGDLGSSASQRTMTIGTPTQAPLRYLMHTRSILVLQVDDNLHDRTSANVFLSAHTAATLAIRRHNEQ